MWQQASLMSFDEKRVKVRIIIINSIHVLSQCRLSNIEIQINGMNILQNHTQLTKSFEAWRTGCMKSSNLTTVINYIHFYLSTHWPVFLSIILICLPDTTSPAWIETSYWCMYLQIRLIESILKVGCGLLRGPFVVNISFPRVHRGRINYAVVCFMGAHRHPPWQTLSSPALSIAHSAVFMGWQQVPVRGKTVQTKGVERLCCNQHRIRVRWRCKV